ITTTGFAETDPKFYAIQASAIVQAAPAQITLSWPADPNATGYTISRKAPGTATWGTPINLPGTVLAYTDSAVVANASYEYSITSSTTPGYRATGYVLAGIDAPLIENRGKVILIVDNTYAPPLASQLNRLQQDLVGDGWTVVRHDVGRNDSVVSIKKLITADYAADPSNVKSLFLFGHVPVPYSGNFNPDGHPDHQGAWPCDAFYGDMDGIWTDSTVNNTGAARPENQNIPGDGKFDQSDLPSDIELQVGRVDLANMTCYSNKTPSRSELDLLLQYLNKDHNFRTAQSPLPRRGIVCDNFGERSGEAFAASGWRNFGPMFGANNVSATPYGTFFSTLNSQGYLWAYGTGGGSYYTCDGVGGSDDFANGDIKAVFTMFLGSYFGDWDNESNFLRAPLGSTSYTLTSSWSGRPHWFYHHMALGETIGYSTRLSQNNRVGGLYGGQNVGTHQAHIALMGDPTLRMHPVIPPSNVTVSPAASGVAITWSPSTDSGLQGHHIYRSTSPDGPFTRLTTVPIPGASFADATGAGSYTYMVRAIKLEISGSGTYFNASQGAFSGTTTTPPPTVTAPAAPSGLVAAAISSAQIVLNWADKANNESGFKIERKTGSTGTYAQIYVASANVQSFTDVSLTPSTQYFYRVRATNTAGDSEYSNEASAITSAVSISIASFIATDTTTHGSWKGVYGADGYNVIADAGNYPAYAQVTPNAKSDWIWQSSTTDLDCLQKVTATDRIAACWYSNTGFSIDLNITDGQKHRIVLYCHDWDASGRQQTIKITDKDSGAVLDSRLLASFQFGTYLQYDLSGRIQISITPNIGNAVISGLFFGIPSAQPTVATPIISPAGGTFTNSQSVSITTATPGAEVRFTTDGSDPVATSPLYGSAITLTNSTTLKAKAFMGGMTASATASTSFTITIPSVVPSGTTKFSALPADVATQGNWQPGYGADGYNLIGDVAKAPAYAQVGAASKSDWLWNGRTTDTRALMTPGGAYRSAGCWYASTAFTIDINFTDGNAHRLAMYCLDWDYAGRSQLVELLDSDSGALLQKTTVSAFTGGQYLAWDILGHVKIRVTRLTGPNAVVNGLFFAPTAAKL
ncbi:MAG: hypothetical protein JWM99_4817, partial [Verrucomicrobiales bacterium]|nr:hypothetical protein [Verrucomicrobiales bacterium]